MNLWTIQSAYIARLQEAAPGLPVVATFDATDWTADDAPRVGAHVTFDGLEPADEVGRSALMLVKFSCHTYLDTRRASAADSTAAEAAVLAALKSAIGWEWKTGLRARLTAGPQTGFDGRVARVTISFAVPAPEAGLA
jgi:hypothetical protein